MKSEKNVGDEIKAINKVAQGSDQEKALFTGCMLDVVDTSKRTKEVYSAIEGLYVSYRNLVDATQTLAVKVYQFQTLTGLAYEKIGEAMSKGLQREFSREYIFRLHRAGHALINCKATRGISDIAKLSELGRHNTDVLNKLVSIDANGLVMIGDSYAQLLSRDKFKSKVAELTGTIQVKSETKSPWDIGAFAKALEKAMEANVNEPAYLHAITEVYNITMAKIHASLESDTSKTA